MNNLCKPLEIIALAVVLSLPISVRAAQQVKNPPPAAASDQARPIEVDIRPQLFATMCALDAAGFESNAITSNQTQGRIQLRERMLALKGPAVEALRKFYKEHALADSGETFSRFMSFALAAGPPPQFAFEMNREALPPDALALDGFNEILANFYREAQLDQLWQRFQPDYQRGVELYQAPVSEIVLSATTYLREIIKSSTQRTFTVVVDPLVGGKSNFRNYGDHYYLVVGTGTDLPLDDIRHSFLHFLLDPIAIRYRTQAMRAEPLLAYASHAPQLPTEYHDDFPAFFDECLVRAVELRLRRLSPEKLAAEIDHAETSGYVLVRPIYSGLSGFEKSAPAMSFYLPDLIRGIDVPAEARRLRGVTFADADAPAAPESSQGNGSSSVEAKTPASADPQEADLAEGERQIAVRNGTAAAASFERVLATSPGNIRATYGLAVSSALLGQPDRARELFAKVIAAASSSDVGVKKPDPFSLSWSHIYLGRMYDVEGSRDLAVAEYKAALVVQDLPESARAAAQRGVDVGYQTPSRDANPEKKQ